MRFKNFSNYEIYPDEGKIWSYKTNKFVGAPNESRGGYWQVTLTDDDGEKKTFLLSRVIWMTVNGDIPENMEINHKSERKGENFISNLELVDKKTNINYGTRNARAAEKLTNRQDLSKQVGAYQNGVLIMTFQSTREAERQGYQHGSISACCRGERKTHRGYTWKYIN